MAANVEVQVAKDIAAGQLSLLVELESKRHVHEQQLKSGHLRDLRAALDCPRRGNVRLSECPAAAQLCRRQLVAFRAHAVNAPLVPACQIYRLVADQELPLEIVSQLVEQEL